MKLEQLFNDKLKYTGEDVKNTMKLYLESLEEKIWKAIMIGDLKDLRTRIDKTLRDK